MVFTPDIPKKEAKEEEQQTGYTYAEINHIPVLTLINHDCKFRLKYKSIATGSSINLCHFWFNTRMLHKEHDYQYRNEGKQHYRLRLNKSQIDKARKDIKCDKFHDNFAMELLFVSKEDVLLSEQEITKEHSIITLGDLFDHDDELSDQSIEHVDQIFSSDDDQVAQQEVQQVVKEQAASARRGRRTSSQKSKEKKRKNK